MVRPDGSCLFFENVAPEPERAFDTARRAWTPHLHSALAILHSHPDGDPCPSPADQVQQIATGRPWYIRPRGGEGFWFGDPYRPPLWERPYRFGATDCFGLVRDALHELWGVACGNHPRTWGFDTRGEPLFEARFAHEGWSVVSDEIAQAAPGDVVLFSIKASVANHCAVILEDGQMLHHPSPGIPYAPVHRPRVQSAGRWGRLPLRVIRRVA